MIGRKKLTDFAFPLFRIFSSSKGALHQAVIAALAEMQYKELERPLWNWLDELLASDEVNLPALQCATKNLLLFDPDKSWWKINKRIGSHYNNHIKSLALFGGLSEYITTQDQLNQSVQHYAAYRNHFTDPQFMNYFWNVFDNQEIIEFIRLRMNYGYSMRLIFQECLNLLEWHIPATLTEVLKKIDTCCTEQSPHLLPGVLIESIRIMSPDGEKSLEEHFLEAFQGAHSDWEDTIITIQDQEFFFMLSLPLVHFIKEIEKTCLAFPQENTTRIARIYHSPFLRSSFMTRVINLLADKLLERHSQSTQTIDFINDNPKEALWRLVTGQAEIIDYPFSLILPKPWEYDIPFLIPHLIKIYKKKFEHFIATSQHKEIDYALELFKKEPDQEIVILTLKHFTLLINQHFHLFFEFIEHIPDQRFIAPLIHHHREGEEEIQQLIELLCEIHHHPNPFSEPTINQKNIAYARILCPECHTSYRYSINALYFDQEVLEQRRLFTNHDIWTTDVFVCKNCHAILPFEVGDNFLANLYAEMLTAHLLKLNEEEKEALAIYHPLHFPQYFGKKTNPSVFLKKVEADLHTNRLSKKKQSQLLLELGKLYLAIEKLAEAQEAFRQSLDLVGSQPFALFNLGVIAFRQKNIHDARLHFSRFTRLYHAKDFEQEEENLFNLASHYLEILDHREFKRTTFKLINS
ncbi:MAG: tetratricopeptide repeat protein [SAR324 cluster bacterium]|nr:tetratricopeptide repeat protein [SAR324 cluster bacterium]